MSDDPVSVIPKPDELLALQRPGPEHDEEGQPEDVSHERTSSAPVAARMSRTDWT